MKFVLNLIFIISAVSAEKLCTPGSVFEKDCNLCSCTADGLLACTDMICPERERTSRSVEMLCQPLSTFSPDDCNSCKCSADGKRAMCTMALCPEKTKVVKSPKQVCKPKSQFKNYCNTCTCSEAGTTAACTRMLCDKAIWNEDGSLKHVARSAAGQKRVCEPKTQFKNYCNTCTCSDDGTTAACTRMLCDKAIWNEDGSLKLVARSAEDKKRVCEPKSQFKNYCNTCACSEDGTTFACTRMLCDKDIWNEDGSLKFVIRSTEDQKRVCKPNTKFNDDCNVCMCSNDGLSKMCTMMDCMNGAVKIHKRSADDLVCTAKSQFNEYCNTCLCSADGKSKACTMMYCDKDNFNFDGTLKAIPSSKKNLRAAKSLVCTPNSRFMESCNTCHCSSDGLTKLCTMLACLNEA